MAWSSLRDINMRRRGRGERGEGSGQMAYPPASRRNFIL